MTPPARLRSRIVRSLLACLAATGCAATGGFTGRLELPGQPPAPVTFAYRTDPLSTGGQMFVTLPSGELFTGRYFQSTSATEAQSLDQLPSGWESGNYDWGPYDDDSWHGIEESPLLERQYSRKVRVALQSDQGRLLRCRITLADPAAGLGGGGSGRCLLSTGGRIDIRF
ncbi:MAG: hypothetical protein L0027_07370 [Candidatus Rokubacteria bacterium]|nr:hypothetical protein [Candidatus Rokubacteria bacterium]